MQSILIQAANIGTTKIVCLLYIRARAVTPVITGSMTAAGEFGWKIYALVGFPPKGTAVVQSVVHEAVFW